MLERFQNAYLEDIHRISNAVGYGIILHYDYQTLMNELDEFIEVLEDNDREDLIVELIFAVDELTATIKANS